MKSSNPRYRIDRFTAESLKCNPIDSPAERELSVYLPPGYEDAPGRRYPVVYFLHGYGQDSRHWTVESWTKTVFGIPLLVRLLLPCLHLRLLYFETLDALIWKNRLMPFIFVQPDASLHLSHRHGRRWPDGNCVTKGSLYTDSSFTGRFGTYIFEEVVDYVDANYRTVPDREWRALMGGSMGGYGALLGGISRPERFSAVAALSPAVNCLDLLDRTPVFPYQRVLLGRRKAREWGREDLDDILDTCDLVYSRDRPLLPTVVRNKSGRAVHMDEEAMERWAAADLVRLAESTPSTLRNLRLLINCEAGDEFGFADGVRRLHGVLTELGVTHEFEVYTDTTASRWSSHVFGIAWRILPGIRFCLEGLTADRAP